MFVTGYSEAVRVSSCLQSVSHAELCLDVVLSSWSRKHPSVQYLLELHLQSMLKKVITGTVNIQKLPVNVKPGVMFYQSAYRMSLLDNLWY